MDALPNDEALRMEEFTVQPMPVATPMPWENYGIMMNPFQNPMQMMRQVYPLPAQHLDLVQQHVTQQEQLVDQQQEEQQLQLLPHEQPQLQLLSQEQAQLLIPHPQQVQLLPQPQQVQLSPQLIERKPTSDGASKLAVPQGPDAIRTKLREALTDALKMVAAEQTKEDLLAFLDSSKAEAVVSIRTSTDPESYDFLDHHDFQFPPPVIVRKPRSKLQAHGGKGSPNKRMRVDNSSGDGVEAWEQKVANHAKLLSRNIELELLRMFKDVNKKYKEKARSLKFNLADKNNPELRGRVFFGEISPPVLCNMTIEQLASKELSEWRMAKAEERAHMVVITDEDVNTSKLVKKTHKGEFIMEVDNDTATDVLAPVASSVKDESEGSEEAEQVDEVVGVEEQTDIQEETMLQEEQAELTEQSEQTEMTELTGGEETTAEGSTAPNEAPVADGGDPAKSVGSNYFEENSDVLDVSDFKGLPEIMSMDGYLKSVGCAQREDGTPLESETMNGESKTSDLPSAEREKTPEEVKSTLVQTGDNPLKRKQPEEPSEIRERSRSSSPRPSNESPRAEKDSPRPPTDGSSPRARAETVGEETSRSVEVWDGSLQLTGTRSTAVRAVFRSGQDVKLDAWPKSLGVKGRVKVGHLAKFLKELCSSKSRTVTALSFYSSDMATSSLSLLKEVVDGYVKGERVGYVEPSTGFELYLLPPGEASWKLLTENGRLKPGDVSGIPSDRSEVLVGCVVWRKSPSSVSQSERSKKSHHHHHNSSGSSSSSKNKIGSTSASRSKQTPSVSASQAPPVSTLPFVTSTATPATVTPAAPPSTLSLQQSSQSVVVKHPVNEWHQSSLCPMPPVGVDSVVAAPVPGLRAAPPFTLGGMFFPPGFAAPANNNTTNNNSSNGLQHLLPGGMLSGLEGGGPPGFRQHCRPTSLDDLPDYDELLASSAPPLSYGLSTSFGSGVGNQYSNHNSSSVNSLTDAFQARGFQANTVASAAAAPESFVIPRGSQDVHHHHGFGHRPEWASTGVVAQVAPQVTSAQHAQHVQHHMFMQQPSSQQHPQAQRGPPPLPPGPPPPPFGQWRHPNQSSLHYKKGHHSNGQRRYRS